MLLALGGLVLLFVLLVVVLLVAGFRPRRASRSLGKDRSGARQSRNSSSSSL